LQKNYKQKLVKNQPQNHIWGRFTGRTAMEDWLVVAVLTVCALLALAFLNTELWTKILTFVGGSATAIYTWLKGNVFKK